MQTDRQQGDFIEELPQVLAFSPDGHWLAGGSADDTVRLWDVSTHRQIAVFGHTGWVEAVVFSPDGRTLVSTDAFGAVKLWDLAPTARSAC
ncbi:MULTISPECIES: WD40 repeat domain-containing protein [Nonomuraea]|uniref:WD40 repeat domain-containing protein n=1 Tax=Nonomuraea mangrovi TaxID=2316207 RepID=A0ABW4T6N9_9ACTN